ncbi:hypothetical protein HWV62_26140 [Athelia sp. TMB]|nr:hypothetical protein HWV62_26140 [Athelia sp. TMB]
MSLLTLLLSGAVGLFLWIEVDEAKNDNPPMDQTQRIAFILSAVVQTLLFMGSILGFVGAIVRKQSFVQIYSWFIWIHLCLNIAAGSFFLWVITHTLGTGEMQCKQGVLEDGEKQVCSQVLTLAGALLIGIVVVIWLVEIYGALIIARYTHQIKEEKREIRRQLLELSVGHGSAFRTSEVHVGLLAPHATNYQDANVHHEPQEELGPPVYDAENEGYGGGRWSLQEISADEKRRLREAGDLDNEGE